MTNRYDPDLLDRLHRRRKKKRRDSCLSRVMIFLFVVSVAAALFFAWVLMQKSGGNRIDESQMKTLWFEQTYEVRFSTMTATSTHTFTPTVPTSTMSPTASMTSTVTPTSTETLPPRLSTRTSVPHGRASSTPMMLLVAAETEIAAMRATEMGKATPIVPLPTPNMWFERQGMVGAMNADWVYPNANCSWMGVAGTVTDTRNDPVIGIFVQVGYFEDEEVRETLTGLFPIYGESGYEITLARPVQKFESPLWIQLLNEDHVPVSEKVYFKPSDRCERSLILINFQKKR